MADELVLSVPHAQGEILFDIERPVSVGAISSFEHFEGTQHSFAGVISEVEDFEDYAPNSVESTYRFPASDINYGRLDDEHVITFSLVFSSSNGKRRTKALTMSKGKVKKLP